MLNTNTTAVNLSGWSLQYADVGSGTWQVAALAGQLLPGQYYLVQAQSGSSGVETFPPRISSRASPSARAAGKVALVNSTTPLTGTAPSGAGLLDLVGYGAADAFEGTAPAPATDPTTADVRLGGGFTETEQNGDDFIADTPNPHNSAASVETSRRWTRCLPRSGRRRTRRCFSPRPMATPCPSPISTPATTPSRFR